MARRNRSSIVDNDDLMDLDIPGDRNGDHMDVDDNITDKKDNENDRVDGDDDSSDDDSSDDEPEHNFYDCVDDNEDTDDDGIGSDCYGDVEEFDFDSEFETDLESDSDSDSQDEDEQFDSYIDIGIGLDDVPDGELGIDTDGDIVVGDASDDNKGSENGKSGAEPDANIEANKKDADKGPGSRTFDLQKGLDNMSSIDMDDDEAIEKMIGDALNPSDRKAMEMSQAKMDSIISKLPDNAEGLDVVENEPEAKRCIEKYRERLRSLLEWLARLMLAIGDCDNLPLDMKPWVIFTVANASKECRERLLQVFTCPAIHPLCYQ